MHKRCENHKSTGYANYGARGISVCDEWKDYAAFRDWAIKNGYEDTFSIDRIDVNRGYSPDNCRWADCITQANNRRSNNIIEYNGESHTLAEWSRILGKPYKQLHKNIFTKGMSVDSAFNL